MTPLMTVFKKDMHTALQNYARQLTHQNKRMPSHRQKDIAEIRKILNTPTEDIIQQIQAIQQQTKRFYTGFLFWRTGKSKLKNELENVMRPYLNVERNEALLEIHAHVSKENFRASGMKRS